MQIWQFAEIAELDFQGYVPRKIEDRARPKSQNFACEGVQEVITYSRLSLQADVLGDRLA